MRYYRRRRPSNGKKIAGNAELRKLGRASRLRYRWNFCGGNDRWACFDNVADMWCTLNNVPALLPSHCGLGIRQRGDRMCVNELSVFRDGFNPAWENYKHGGIADCKVATSPKQICILWLHLLLSVLGMDADETQSIVGIRLVNKSTAYPMVKFELWLCDDAVPPSKVKKWIEDLAKSVGSIVVAKYTSYVSKMQFLKCAAARSMG